MDWSGVEMRVLKLMQLLEDDFEGLAAPLLYLEEILGILPVHFRMLSPRLIDIYECAFTVSSQLLLCFQHTVCNAPWGIEQPPWRSIPSFVRVKVYVNLAAGLTTGHLWCMVIGVPTSLVCEQQSPEQKCLDRKRTVKPDHFAISRHFLELSANSTVDYILIYDL